MKKFYIILIAMLFVNGAIAQWFPQNSSTTNNLYEVYFTDANTGYVVGEFGTILKTTDGGAIWDTLSSGTTVYLASVYFTSNDTGYVVGEDSTILKTNDGGLSWESQPLGISGNLILFSVFFTDVDTGYAAGFFYITHPAFGLKGMILKTVNGGSDWAICYEGSTWSIFSSICFTDANTGYILTGGGIGKTVNAGLNWTEEGITQIRPSSVYFPTSDTGYIVGRDDPSGPGEYNFGKTTNGGADWTFQNTGLLDTLTSVYFTDAENGYSVSESGIIINTNNGGIDWNIQYSDSTMSLNSVYFVDENIGYVVGENGTILKTTNGGLPVSINDQPLTTESIMIFPNPSSTQITISTPTTPEKNTILTICNFNGQQFILHQLTEQQTVFDVFGLPQGIYIVKVMDDRTVRVGKFIKDR